MARSSSERLLLVTGHPQYRISVNQRHMARILLAAEPTDLTKENDA